MADRTAGRVIYQKRLSSKLQLFRLAPEEGTEFPDYTAGQHADLSRDNCRLTTRRVMPEGKVAHDFQRDAAGNVIRGVVTRTYSIASAPWETRKWSYLEFFVGLEPIESESSGLLSESLFSLDPKSEDIVHYENVIRGDFTIPRRTEGFHNVVLVGTGTGIATFVSMVKQLHHDCILGLKPTARFTLFHGSATRGGLAYLSEMQSIEQEHLFDFTYVPSVSRPDDGNGPDPAMGRGRATSLLRIILGMPIRGRSDSQNAGEENRPNLYRRNTMIGGVEPALPVHHPMTALRERVFSPGTIILVCGNPGVVDEVKSIAAANRLPCESE